MKHNAFIPGSQQCIVYNNAHYSHVTDEPNRYNMCSYFQIVSLDWKILKMLFIKIQIITTQKEQLALFEKVMQDSEHINEMLVQMKAQQQIQQVKNCKSPFKYCYI